MDDDQHDRTRTAQGRFTRSTTEVDHDADAAELRGDGLSYAEIGRRLGVSKSTAWERVQSAWRETLTEPADRARAVELARLVERRADGTTVADAQYYGGRGSAVFLYRVEGEPGAAPQPTERPHAIVEFGPRGGVRLRPLR